MDSKNVCHHLEVTLYNTCEEYGITLSGGSEHNTPLYIAKVKIDTPAYRCGLKKRDIILSINSYNCIQCKHNTAVTLIRLNPNLVKFVIYRPFHPTPIMSNLFEEIKTYLENKNIILGQILSDDTDILENYKLSSPKQNTKLTDNHSPNDNEINGLLSNTLNNVQLINNGVAKEEQASSKISLSSFGSDWYKNYATNTVKAKQNVTVKDIMKQERSKSLNNRPYLKSSSTNNTHNNGCVVGHKVQAMVESFNNQPQHIAQNISRSPSKSHNEEETKYEAQYNEVDHSEIVSNELILKNPAKYLRSTNSFPYEQINSVYEAVAACDYVGKGPCEINLTQGNKLIILRSIDSNWYEGFTDYPYFKIIPKHMVAIDRIVFVNNGVGVEINQRQLPSSSNH